MEKRVLDMAADELTTVRVDRALLDKAVAYGYQFLGRLPTKAEAVELALHEFSKDLQMVADPKKKKASA